MARNSAAISPTAHYTGYVWADRGLGPSELSTWQGRVLHSGLRPVMALSRALGGATVDEFLLARHHIIDHLLEEAIGSGQIAQVIELAAGMSPRGYTFARRHGARITFVEVDLPEMAARKRQVLAKLGSLGTHHRMADVDVLQADGPQSLHALAQTLDPARGLAVVTEGLLNYLPQDSVLGLWARVADVCSGFPAGRYLSDLHLGEDLGAPVERAFVAGLAVFVRGRIHVHFATAAEAEKDLLTAGFAAANLHRPREFGHLPATTTRGARSVRIVDAHS